MVRPPLPSPQNAQHVQQFLSTVLSQRGPDSLPYSEDTKWLIRHHLVSLVENYPSLQVKAAYFTHNDGRMVNLLQAEGTIPICYQEITYNLPVIIWLMESYPRQQPCVYLAPTRDMVIKRGHPNVNPSALVSVPYLQTWVFPSSNLVDLTRILSHQFGRDPPLFTKLTRSTLNSNLNPVQSPSPSPSSSNCTPSSSIPSPSRPYSSSPYGGHFPTPQRPTEDPAETFRRNAIKKLVDKIHSDITALRRHQESEMEALFSIQAALRQREVELSKGLRGMQDEKEGLEHQLQIVLMNSDILEAWVKESEEKRSKAKNMEIGELFETADTFSKQLLECTSADLAVEDVMYSLDKAVQEGAISFESYLKHTRVLSREQFFHRALSAKIRNAQVQAQVARMAARTPHHNMQEAMIG